ncbi:MAG: hypothetical protein COB41_03560 [Proteobacteria bacterium]|nr:MAG: hypothetical protein COB41_03560 [Pseudomonadota bacterium]
MKTNAVDLRRNMKDIMRAVDRHEAVTVFYHGKEKAVILPIEHAVCEPVVEHAFFGMHGDVDESVEQVMEGLRDGRY